MVLIIAHHPARFLINTRAFITAFTVCSNVCLIYWWHDTAFCPATFNKLYLILCYRSMRSILSLYYLPCLCRWRILWYVTRAWRKVSEVPVDELGVGCGAVLHPEICDKFVTANSHYLSLIGWGFTFHLDHDVSYLTNWPQLIRELETHTSSNT